MAKEPDDKPVPLQRCHTCFWWEPHADAARGCCHVAPAQLVHVAFDHDGKPTPTWGVPVTERLWRCPLWKAE